VTAGTRRRFVVLVVRDTEGGVTKSAVRIASFLLLYVAACSPAAGAAAPFDPRAPSEGGGSHAAPLPDAGVPAARDAGAADRLSEETHLPKDAIATFVSGGHAGARFKATLFANDAARPLFAAAGGTASGRVQVTSGARIVMTHADARDAKGPILVMTREKEWRFEAYDGDGTRLSVETASCAACHREAGPGRDGVYPLPRP
jgi:hypothetical protein